MESQTQTTKEDSWDKKNARTSVERIVELSKKEDTLDAKFGFNRIIEGPERLGWLVTMRPTIIEDAETKVPRSALDLYFIQQDGSTFKASLPVHPYFYLGVKEGFFEEVETYLRRKYERHICKIDPVQKEDLELRNHLAGLKKTYLRLSFMTVQSLLVVRDEMMPLVKKNKERGKVKEIYQGEDFNVKNRSKSGSILEAIVDIREYDVTYYIRAAIDKDIRCGNWYNVKPKDGAVLFEPRRDLVARADPKVLAFDIETTKSPLKFPDAASDQIMMISYMVNGEGYLIVNREVVLADIEDFEYTPKPEYEGIFKVFNEPDEVALLRKFFSHVRELRPNVFVTFNGDFFDWPFVEARAKFHKMSMYDEIGVYNDKGEYKCRFGSHMDAFAWVKRDSYLPQGSQGLKAVTKAKLGYNPMEIDPEEMVKFAAEKPHTLASYSVSDAVATYYLYSKYVHPFIFSLCTIIPMNPDDVLRKGSGTLCETLLMTEAFKVNVIYPNKYTTDPGKMYQGKHLIETETYVGGHVEALESGVFRSDLGYKFNLDPEAVDLLISEMDSILRFGIEVEGGIKKESITNYEEVKKDIISKLEALKAAPRRKENPVIYHLDVMAMYPNIILTNRLQPSAVVTEEDCASCIHNKPENNCKRNLTWVWRGDFVPANRSEYELIRTQLETERLPDPRKIKDSVGFYELSSVDQHAAIRDRLKDYSKKVYKSTHKTVEEDKVATICQRENPFYVDTVKAFRDRRYIYKENLKEANKGLDKAKKEGKSQAAINDAQKLVVLYDSLQLAHKCILNSFYGYVMAKGSRWFSMEMAGAVTYTGAQIIKQARELVEKLGRPLELDTDGIWCILPGSFPQNFKFLSSDPKKPSLAFSFPCTMLNVRVAQNFTNHQYQTLVDPEKLTYETQSECSIFFEVDGPYKAMILPASKEEGKKIKKRYAVFNHNNQLQELKGFEIKRRGELKLIKTFQSQIFEKFLDGGTLEECYQAAASVANNWLDLLDSKGANVDDGELLDLLTQTNNMSKKLEDYGKQKSAAITAAKRLGEFLDEKMTKEKGITCAYIVGKQPEGSPVTDRIIPTAIFSSSDAVKKIFLKRWCHTNSTDIRDILDWNYYRERLASVIQKIITIPAFMQQITNPVPRVVHPTWLVNKHSNVKISDIFQKVTKQQAIEDMENIGNKMFGVQKSVKVPVVTIKRRRREYEDNATSPAKDQPVDTMITDEPANADKQNEDEDQNKEEEPVDQFQVFLAQQKKKWKAQLKERRRRKKVLGTISKDLDHRTARSLMQSTMNLIQNPWQVIQIADTEKPGEFKVWVLAGSSLESVQLNVPRTFFINTSSDKLTGKKVAAELPRSKPRQNLFEFHIPEMEFRHSQKYISTLFTAAEVEGVYESRVPLNFRAVLQLGSVCQLTKVAKSQGAKDAYAPSDLELIPKGNTYLQANSLKRIFLYHSFNDKIGIWGIFMMEQQKAHVVIIDPNQNAQLPGIRRQLKERLASFEFEISQAKDKKAAYATVDKTLKTYADKNKATPTVMLTQCTKSYYELSQNIEALNNFPNVSVPANEQDNNYSLGWQAKAAAVLAQRYLAVDGWFKAVLERARYSQVPIGNLETDHPVYFSDIMFSRLLKKNNNLLWISETTLPDLGGSEEDDKSFAEELVTPEVLVPGCYKSVCIELDLIGLAVNTILQSNSITEIEGGSSLLSFDFNPTLDDDMNKVAKSIRSFDETFGCLKAFKILKSLITEWSCNIGQSFSDDEQTESVADSNPAAILLGHFYRWISNPHSKLYDPSLHRMIHNFIKKVFWQLLAELRNLGSTVVFANFNKIIICTNKKGYDNATTYWDFINRNITGKSLFTWITLQPVRFWETLMFMDSANYGGYVAGTEKIISNWNIADFLPSSIHKHFDLILTDYVIQTRKNKTTSDDTLAAKSHDKENNDPNSAMDEDQDTDDSSYKKISFQFTQKMFHLLEEIQRSLSGDHSSEGTASAEFPKLAGLFVLYSLTTVKGSHLPLNNPALEFIKTVCHVLALDKNIENEVFRLRKALLKFIHIREFSKEAEFVNPCLSYVLHDVMCTFCSSTRDMDLLRDPDLMQEEWTCDHCKKNYHKPSIEATLVEILQKRSLCYQLQDLVCEKCKQVKPDNMSDICTNCSGKFVCKISEAEFKKSILAFKKIGEYHELPWLDETVDLLLKN